MQGASQSQIKAVVAGLVLKQLGFQVATNTLIPKILNSIEPSGGTAFRDALINGCNLLIKLYQFLKQTGQSQTWNLVQVILTDGDDYNSETDLMKALQVMYVIGKLVQVNMLKVIFIGVGVSEKAELEMMLLAKAGGENAEYYRVDDADIGSIFQKITVKLGLEKRQNIIGVANNSSAAFLIHQEVNPYLSIQRQNYSVLFNLDVSSSMSGNKWKSVCQSVQRFTSFLGENDLISAMIFNEDAKLLSSMSMNDPLFKKKVVQSRAPTPPANKYQVVPVVTSSTNNQPKKKVSQECCSLI